MRTSIARAMLERLARHRPRAPLQVDPDSPVGAPFTRSVSAQPEGATPVTDMLYDRLMPETVAAIADRVEVEHRTMWEAASSDEHRRIALSFGLLYDVDGVASATRLSSVTPPPEVHSMVHGWVTEMGGSYYLADMVWDTLAQAGAAPRPGSRILDFSCSSGRVVRPLIAALPEAGWFGCDPNAEAIEWMRESVPGISVEVTPPMPPMSYADRSFDAVFASSVWSHYSAAGALTWLSELHRILRPGGHALITTHGLQACVWFTVNHDPAITAKLGDSWITQTRARLEHDGHCFWDVFGETGDWGVVDAEWGLAFFTPEWLLERITPQWSLTSYRLGRAYGNQDVYLLERR
jgi:SAM-dependent methyltransferase